MKIFIVLCLLFAKRTIQQDLRKFICVDGTEIKLKQVCDGEAHCPDRSDEVRNLCHHIICPSNMFRCHYGACILKTSRCDGVPQCADKSDESQCGKEMGSCEYNEFRCTLGNCIDIKKLCDGENNCIDASDESKELCEDLLCPTNTYHCTHGGCIHADAQCNGFKDCVDGSDESEILCKSLRCKETECKKVQQSITCDPIISSRIEVKCQSMYGDKKGIVPCYKPLPVGTIARYKCKQYFLPINKIHANNKQTICQADGTWSREHLKCEPECGHAARDVAPLVVHGWLAEPGMWPWHTTLYTLEEGSWTFWCGGSLISEKVVLTAAHCTWGVMPENLKAASGKFYSDFNKRQDFTQINDISKIIRHPLYQDTTGNYGSDLAILILSKSVELSSAVRPVCIDWEFHDMNVYLSENALGLISGMGITENNDFSPSLRTTYLPVVSDKECIKEQTSDFKKYVTYTSFCAGWKNGSGVCNGDSGGGLVFPKATDRSSWVLQGIVSVSPRRRGTSFCDPKYYTVFTKVGMYVDWIKSILNTVHLEEFEVSLDNLIM